MFAFISRHAISDLSVDFCAFLFVLRSLKIWNCVGNVVVRFREVVFIPSQDNRCRLPSNVIDLVKFSFVFVVFNVVDLQMRW